MRYFPFALLLLTASLATPLLYAQDSPSPTQREPVATTPATKQGPPPASKSAGTDNNLAQPVTNSYALVIGIAEYANLPENAQLTFPARDAAGMYMTLTGLKGGQFPPKNVHLLMNEHATIANIRHEVEEWLPSVATDNDRVVIYFSGHAFISKQIAYLASYDVDIHNIPATAYRMDALGTAIGGKIRGKWKVLIAEGTHTGAIMPMSDPEASTRVLNKINSSVFSLTATRDRNDNSFESDRWGDGHGAFTYYVMKGLEGEADANGDGIVDADELADYVHTKVREATQGRENPTSERGSFDPHMVLAFDPSRAVGRNAPPAQVGTLIVSANKDDTDVFVDGKYAGIVDKTVPLRLPGLTPGPHVVSTPLNRGEREWKSEEQVFAGADTPVMIHRMALAQAKKTEPVRATKTQPAGFFRTGKKNVGISPVPSTPNYAVIIGISSYKNLPVDNQLKFADKDAEAMYKTLTDPLTGQFAAKNVHRLINQQATRANIRHEIEDWLPTVADDDSQVVIYFAGHGVVAHGMGYLASFDFNNLAVAESSYSMDALGAVFTSKVKGSVKILLTDACHAGALNPEMNQLQWSHGLLDPKNSLISLTASRDREQSFESDRWGGGHGVFTYYLVKGLKGDADTDGDGLVTVGELIEYVRTSVRIATDKQQNPTSERGSFDPKTVISNLWEPGQRPTPPPASP